MEIVMNFLKVEADRLRSALQQTPLGARFDELYAAQQAIQWAIDPTQCESPMDMINRFNLSIREGSEDCQSSSRLALS